MYSNSLCAIIRAHIYSHISAVVIVLFSSSISRHVKKMHQSPMRWPCSQVGGEHFFIYWRNITEARFRVRQKPTHRNQQWISTEIFWRKISNLPKRSEGTWSNKQKKSKNRSLNLRNMYSVFEVFSTFITFNPFCLWKHQSMLSYLWEATPNMEPVFANGARSQNLMGSGQPSNLSNEKRAPT